MSKQPEEGAGKPSQPETASDAPSPTEDFTPASTQAPRELDAIQTLQDENKRLTDQLLRKQAELENFRKRALRETEESLQYALSNILKSLLPVLDGFERAFQSDGGGEEYRRGVELIYQQFCDALGKLGLEPMEATGREFDPYQHEAIATVETDEVPDQQVLEEIQRGYFFKQRLLRPALVKVARRRTAEEPSAGGNVQPE
jgi:molecular chaperone GrpE